MGSVELNTHLPHPARVYDFLLGGKDHFQADRDMGMTLIEQSPSMPISARANRAFMARAARFLAAEMGIRQFLDIGTGLPTVPNLHEAAQSVAPSCRVVYVDNDPIVLVHARALLTSAPEGRTTYVEADLREPERILSAPEVLDTLDFSQPVAVFLIAILHFVVDDDEAQRIVDTLMRPLVPGSALALTVFTDRSSPHEVGSAVSVAGAGGISIKARGISHVQRFLAGTDVVEPGVVLANRWRPDDAAREVDDANVHVYAGVGIKR